MVMPLVEKVHYTKMQDKVIGIPRVLWPNHVFGLVKEILQHRQENCMAEQHVQARGAG